MTTLEVPGEAETTVMIGLCGRRDRPDRTDPGTAGLVPVAPCVAASAQMPAEAAALVVTRWTALIPCLVSGAHRVAGVHRVFAAAQGLTEADEQAEDPATTISPPNHLDRIDLSIPFADPQLTPTVGGANADQADLRNNATRMTTRHQSSRPSQFVLLHLSQGPCDRS